MALLPIAALLDSQQLLALVIPGLDGPEHHSAGPPQPAGNAWSSALSGKIVLLRAPDAQEQPAPTQSAEEPPPPPPPPPPAQGVSWSVWPLQIGLAELLDQQVQQQERDMAAAWSAAGPLLQHDSLFAPD